MKVIYNQEEVYIVYIFTVCYQYRYIPTPTTGGLPPRLGGLATKSFPFKLFPVLSMQLWILLQFREVDSPISNPPPYRKSYRMFLPSS
jgi:hypothetical protein